MFSELKLYKKLQYQCTACRRNLGEIECNNHCLCGASNVKVFSSVCDSLSCNTSCFDLEKNTKKHAFVTTTELINNLSFTSQL